MGMNVDQVAPPTVPTWRQVSLLFGPRSSGPDSFELGDRTSGKVKIVATAQRLPTARLIAGVLIPA